MPSLSLSAWYAACTGAVALSPWLVVLLTDAGFGDAQASALLAVLPVGRMLGLPLWAALADRTSPERVLRWTLLLAAIASVALLLVRDPWLVFLAMLLWSLSRAPAFPIVDATTVSLVGLRYGQIRAAGSLAFLVVAGLSGAMRELWTPLPVLVSTLLSVLTLLLTFRLPPLVRAAHPPRGIDLSELLRHRVLVPLAVVSVLHGAAISSYDQLFAMHVEQLHLGSWVTGLSLAVGVTVEIVFMMTSERWLAVLSPSGLLMLAVAAGVPRFLLTALVHDPVGLIAIQMLHGLHFGVYWLASTAVFAAHAPPSLRHTTQALLPAAMFGAGPLVGLLIGAAVLSRADTSTLYFIMAGISALATAIWMLRPRETPPDGAA